MLKILDLCKKNKNPIILYTIVDTKLAKFLDINSKLTKKIIDKTIKQKPDEIFTYLNYVERIPNTPMPYSFYIKLNTLIRKQNTKYGYTYHKSNLLMKKIVKLIDSV